MNRTELAKRCWDDWRNLISSRQFNLEDESDPNFRVVYHGLYHTLSQFVETWNYMHGRNDLRVDEVRVFAVFE